MTDITEILERFNRKERNLLVRDLLDCQPGVTPLSEDFCDRVGKALGIRIPQTAWWATDYHLNWIAGAMALWRDGENAIGVSQATNQEDDPLRKLVQRNQEDADLLIAFDQTLVLIEVKAFGYFTNKQIDSKVQRWLLLNQFCKQAVHELTLQFMLMSRSKPTGLKPPPTDLLPGKSEWPHAVLKLHSPSQKLKVTGRNPVVGSPGPDGHSWYVVPVSVNDEEETGTDPNPPI